MYIGVYEGKPRYPTGYRWVKKVKDYVLNGDKVSVEEEDRSVWIYSADEVVAFDPEGCGSIALRHFKVPERQIIPILEYERSRDNDTGSAEHDD